MKIFRRVTPSYMFYGTGDHHTRSRKRTTVKIGGFDIRCYFPNSSFHLRNNGDEFSLCFLFGGILSYGNRLSTMNSRGRYVE